MAGTISTSSTIAVTLSSTADNPLTVTGSGTIDAPSGVALSLQAPVVWTVDNYGLLAISGTSGQALSLGAGGTIDNEAGGSIIGVAYGADIAGGAGSVTNAGLIESKGTPGIALGLSGGGSVFNDAHATISGGNGVKIGGTTGTVSNSGLISATAAGAILSTGTVANLAGGVIASANTGVVFSGYGLVTNSASATITAAFGVVAGIVGMSGTASAVIDNSGLITATTQNGIGVFLSGGGNVSNAAGGTIDGGLYGVDVWNGGRTVTNAGMIGATNGVAIVTTFGGTAASTITNTGSIVGSAGGIRITSATGSVSNSGLIDGTGQYGIRLESGGNITNAPGGIIRGGGGDIAYIAGAGTISNAGTIAGTGSALNAVAFRPGYVNRLIVHPGAVFVGTVNGGNTINATATSALELAAGSGTLAGFTNFGSIEFDPGAAWKISGAPPALAGGELIRGFGHGDTIELAGVNASKITLTGGQTLELTGGLALLLPGNTYSSDQFQVTNSGTNTEVTVACFRAGTRVLTDAGEVAVEALQPGMRVVSLTHKRPLAVKWVGRRRIGCARHPRPEQVWPVRIAAGAFGGGMPHRDLWLSPDHAVFVEGRLIPARHLVNGASIVQVACGEVDYVHVELAGHGVLLADGLPAESYLDTGNRAAFADADAAEPTAPRAAPLSA